MKDYEFFKDIGHGKIELRGDNGGVIKRENDKWLVIWLYSHWTMEDIGRVYRKLKELNKE